MKRFVIVSPTMGVYLGSCMGLGFWSKLDPAGQTSAPTFESHAAAIEHMRTWDSAPIEDATTSEVEPDVFNDSPHRAKPTYASIAACEAAGLAGWDPGA